MSDSKKMLDLRKHLRSDGIAGLWTLMKGFRLLYLGAVLSLAVAALSRTGSFLLLRYYVDQGLAQGMLIQRLYLFSLGFLGLALVEGACSFLKGRLSAQSAESITLRLRNYLFDHLQRLPFGYHDRASTGELIERVTSDVDTLRRFYSEQATQIGRISALFIFNLIALLQLNTLLGLLSLVFLPFIMVQAVLFFKRISLAYEGYQEQEAKLSATLQENVTAARVVRAFARQGFERQKFEEVNWEKYQRGRRFIMLHALYWPTSDILCTLQMLLIFYLGARMAMAGSISLGTYMAVAGLVIWIIWPFRNLGRIVVEASSALVSFRRVNHLIRQVREEYSEEYSAESQPGTADGQASPPSTLGQTLQGADGAAPRKSRQLRGEIAFDRVSFAYREGEKVLHDISFDCRPGQMIALLGSTGSGKSTLVNLLPRFYGYSSGSLKLDGRELSGYSLQELRKQIGIVEQEPFIFSRTIGQNILYGTKGAVSQDEIEQAAEAAAIHKDILGFPDRYDTPVGERGVTLSGGQKQRIAIARTLLRNPRVLILDDATSSVDSETEALIQQALSRLMEGRTSFVIAHRISTVMRADKILVLDQGRLIQSGTHQQLIREEGLYRKIFRLQSRVEGKVQTAFRADGNGSQITEVQGR